MLGPHAVSSGAVAEPQAWFAQVLSMRCPWQFVPGESHTGALA
jgi:hypothetical protein